MRGHWAVANGRSLAVPITPTITAGAVILLTSIITICTVDWAASPSSAISVWAAATASSVRIVSRSCRCLILAGESFEYWSPLVHRYAVLLKILQQPQRFYELLLVVEDVLWEDTAQWPKWIGLLWRRLLLLWRRCLWILLRYRRRRLRWVARKARWQLEGLSSLWSGERRLLRLRWEWGHSRSTIHVYLPEKCCQIRRQLRWGALLRYRRRCRCRYRLNNWSLLRLWLWCWLRDVG